MKTRVLTEIALVAALYVVLTIVFSPISYALFQFRVSEILKSTVIWRPHLIWAFVLGVCLANFYSPYAGLWELAWMPFANLVGAVLCWQAARVNKWIGAALYALIVAFGVGVMLSFILRVSFWLTVLPVLVSELLLIVGGLPIMERVMARLKGL